MLDTVPQLIAIVNAKKEIVTTNRHAESILGYSCAELVGQSVLRIIHSVDRQQVHTIMMKAVEVGRVDGCELTMVRKDGGGCDVRVNIVALRGQADSADATLWVVDDVSEEVRRLAQIGILGSTVDQTPDGVILTDLHGRIMYANRAAEQLYGARSAELQAQVAFALMAAGDEVKKNVIKTLKRRGCWSGELDQLRSDGTRFPARLTLFQVSDDEGAPISVAGYIHDLSDQRMLERQLMQAQRMEAIGRLAGGVAHDFNNLLTVILGTAEIAMAELRDRDPLYSELREIRGAGRRAEALTRQLLAFSRQQILQPEELNINHLVRDMDRMLRRLIGEDVEVVTSFETELWEVKADPGQLEQIVANLAVNARDAMPSGGKLLLETANVVLDADHLRAHPDASKGEHVMLAVSDTGVGMSEETRERIFEPFFTTKEVDRGTGLGLSTVYGIVKQHEGSIGVDSKLQAGTTFRVYLPRTLGGAGTRPRTDLHLGGDPLRGGTETVLVAEDDKAVRRLVVRSLRELGYDVLEACDGRDALQVADRFAGQIHLLLTDVVMPHLGGHEAALQLAQRRPGLRVLYMSGYTSNAIVHKGVLAKGTLYMSKPFTLIQLARRVREALDGDVSGPSPGSSN